MTSKKQTPLTRLFDAVETVEHTPVDEIRAELRREGVDVDGAQRRFDARLDQLLAARALRQRTSGKAAPTADLVARKLQSVRQLGLTIDELFARIAGFQSAAAYRERRDILREDLETHYAELLAIEATERGEAE